MKLSYRGINYDRKSTSNPKGLGELVGKYRGVIWHSRQVNTINLSQSKNNLTYRGVSYR